MMIQNFNSSRSLDSQAGKQIMQLVIKPVRKSNAKLRGAGEKAERGFFESSPWLLACCSQRLFS